MAWTLEAPTSKLRLHPRAEEIPTIPPDEYDELVLDIEKRGIVVPLDVLKMQRADGSHASHPDEAAEIIVLDGRHRLNAAKALGLEAVPIRVVESICWHDDVDDPDEGFTLDECPFHAFEYMVKAATMRRHLTTKQRKHLALSVIISDPSRSDRSVAKETKLSHPTVAKVRAEAEDAGDVERVSTRTDSKGRKQPAWRAQVERYEAVNKKRDQQIEPTAQNVRVVVGEVLDRDGPEAKMLEAIRATAEAQHELHEALDKSHDQLGRFRDWQRGASFDWAALKEGVGPPDLKRCKSIIRKLQQFVDDVEAER
jgi:ParB-like chromosome segregation protein Spo0J